jgi:site-specific recombinase XerC
VSFKCIFWVRATIPRLSLSGQAFAIQQKLGHRSISSTAIYVNLTSQQADSVSSAIMNQLL